MLALASGQSFADTSVKSLENISQELVTVREEIAKLHDQINFEKSQYNDQVRSFANQKSDLEVKSSRADLNIKELERELVKLQELNKQQVGSYDQITPALKQSIALLKDTVSGSLPFKRQERLQALQDISHRLETNLVTPQKAANQLWAFVEDELILGRSSGIYNESLEINGETKLVKVLRVGKVAMFYKSPDEQYGVVKQTDGQWQQQTIDNDDQVRQLNELFDSYAKNIRNGLFTVPNFLPQS